MLKVNKQPNMWKTFLLKSSAFIATILIGTSLFASQVFASSDIQAYIPLSSTGVMSTDLPTAFGLPSGTSGVLRGYSLPYPDTSSLICGPTSTPGSAGFQVVVFNSSGCGSIPPNGTYYISWTVGSQLYYSPYTVSGGVVDDIGVNTSSHIIDFTPEASTTPISNPVTFSLHAYVNPADIGAFLGIKFSFTNTDQNTLLSGLSPYSYTFLDNFSATTSGDFYYSSTTDSLPDGNYRVDASLVPSYLAGIIINPFAGESESHNFVVGASTFVGNFSQNGLSGINAIFASTTATSTASAALACNPVSGVFDVNSCLAYLFIPDGGLIADSLTQFAQQGGTHFPLGYVTDFISIMSSSSASTLPIIDLTVPSGIPGAGAQLNLTLSSTTLAYIYNATETLAFSGSNSSSTETLYGVTSYYWEVLVSIGALFYILARILGFNLVPKNVWDSESAFESDVFTTVHDSPSGRFVRKQGITRRRKIK